MRPVTVLHADTVTNALGERIKTYTDAYSIDMAISTIAGDTVTANNVESVNSTHIGLTNSRLVYAGDRVTADGCVWDVTYVNGDNPRTVLVYLQEVAQHGRTHPD